MRRESSVFLLPYWSRLFQDCAPARPCFGARFESGTHADETKDQHRVLDTIFHFLRSLYSAEGLKQLVAWIGPNLFCAIVCGILFVETGLFVGFLLPGDSLLVTAGIFAGQHLLPLYWLLIPGIL